MCILYRPIICIHRFSHTKRGELVSGMVEETGGGGDVMGEFSEIYLKLLNFLRHLKGQKSLDVGNFIKCFLETQIADSMTALSAIVSVIFEDEGHVLVDILC